MSAPNRFDVIVIGAGPAGSAAALTLARGGANVLIIEKVAFPRFQIGESFLPANFVLMQELGLEEELAKLPQTLKFGAEFGMGGVQDSSLFRFDMALGVDTPQTLNIRRSLFDQMLLDQAVQAGAQLRIDTVREIQKLQDGDVSIQTADSDEPMTAKYLFDASGQATILGRHLNIRRKLPDAHLQKVAYFAHYEGVMRREKDVAGFPLVAMADEGWFWSIPLDEKVTSVGLVMDVEAAKRTGQPASQMLHWGIERCPLLRERMRDAVLTGDGVQHTRADFSYRCAPFAGPGYFLLGDAAVFMDPVFSSGVYLGMKSGVLAAKSVLRMNNGTAGPDVERRRYIREMLIASGWFFRLIKLYYTHSFRELFLHGQGPVQVEKAVMSILAGHVHPEPKWAVRWRFQLFEWFVRLQDFMRVVPRRDRFSLLAQEPVPFGRDVSKSDEQAALALAADSQ